jgi:hypothetical protein
MDRYLISVSASSFLNKVRTSATLRNEPFRNRFPHYL